MNIRTIILSVSVIGVCLLPTGAAAQVRTSTPVRSPALTKDALASGDLARPPWPVDNSTLLVVVEKTGYPLHVEYRNVKIYETDAEWGSKIPFKWWTKVTGAASGRWTVRPYPFDTQTGSAVRRTEAILAGYTSGSTSLATFGQDFLIDFAQYAVNYSKTDYWLEIQPVDRNKQPLAPPSQVMIIRFIAIPM